MKTITSHPYADIFPMMTEDEADALADDIKKNGLRAPIVRYCDKVLDGRNRLIACKKAGVEPMFIDHEGDDASALALVISLNVQRRDLTPGQRAISAARMWGLNGYSKGGRPGKEKPSQTETVSVKDVASRFHVSSNSIQQARDLLKDAPDLAVLVSSQVESLASAHQQLEDRQKEQAYRERNKERIAKYIEAVNNGTMTFEDAIAKACEDEAEAKKKEEAEADSRKRWIDTLSQFVKWTETAVAQWDDAGLEWHTEPDSPGFYNSGVTAKRLEKAAEQLVRISKTAYRGKK